MNITWNHITFRLRFFNGACVTTYFGIIFQKKDVRIRANATWRKRNLTIFTQSYMPMKTRITCKTGRMKNEHHLKLKYFVRKDFWCKKKIKTEMFSATL